MRETPMLFSTPMVLAIRRDASPKTQTRRPVKDTGFYAIDSAIHGAETAARELAALATESPYGQAGDRIWVKETFYAWGRWETRFSDIKARDEWHFVDLTIESGKSYRYAADMGINETPKRCAGHVRWWKRPSIFMPRRASRYTLEISAISVQRLNDISEDDAAAEGIYNDGDIPFNGPWFVEPHDERGYQLASTCYAALWERINGAGSWNANPWVWVIEFKRVK